MKEIRKEKETTELELQALSMEIKEQREISRKNQELFQYQKSFLEASERRIRENTEHAQKILRTALVEANDRISCEIPKEVQHPAEKIIETATTDVQTVIRHKRKTR